MTIASLVVKLTMNVAELHRNAEAAARRVERVGRTITRIGREMTQAISIPLIAAGFAAFHTLLAESARHFGPLWQAFNSLKAEIHDLFLAIGQELEPVFLQVIGLLRSGIAIVRGWIEAFHRLPAGVRSAVIHFLAFAAALGPTLLIAGKLITAIGAMGKVLMFLLTPTGLIVVAITALAAAALYTVTHWEEVQLRFVLLWTAIKEAFFDAVGAVLGVLAKLTRMAPMMGAAIQELKDDFDAFADRSLAKSAAKILEVTAALKKGATGMRDAATQSLAVRDAFNTFEESMRRSRVEGGVLNTWARTLGESFNTAGATATNLKTLIDALIAQGVDVTQVLRGQADSVVNLAAAYQAAGREAALFTLAQQAEASIIQTIMEGVSNSLTAVAERIGEIFAGVRQGFRGFVAQMGALLGAVIKQIGETLIKMGVAAIAAGKLGLAIKFFAKNPIASIAAGAALVALGSALAASSQRTLEQGFSGGGGGGGVEASSAAAAAAEDRGPLILRIDRDVLRFLSPDFVDIIASAIEEGRSRQVIIEEG